MNSITREERVQAGAEPEGRRQTDYPITRPRVIVDEAARSGRERGPRMMSMEELAEERARMGVTDQEPDCDTPTPPASPMPATVPDTAPALLGAAKALQATRAELMSLDGRLAELHEESRDLNELTANLAAVRERRAGLLGDARIAGKKADTAKVDKDAAAAQIALQKREDESVAVERALVTLQTQYESEASTLREQEHAFKEARAAHLSSIMHAGVTALKFHEAIAAARAILAQMAAPFRELLLSANVDLESDQLPSADAVRELVTLRAKADLLEAEELAAVPPPPAPKTLGWVWSDGSVHEDPEPTPEHAHGSSRADVVSAA